MLNNIKKKLIDYLLINEMTECNELTIKVQEVEDSEKTAELIQECESIIRKKKKGIIRIAYHQGMVFKKFKNKEKFKSLVEKLGIHKAALILKINIFKLCQKYTKLLNSSIGLGFFKNHYKDMNVSFHNYLLSS